MISEQGLKERIHVVAKEKGVPFNSCWKQLLFERFLSRLSTSEVAENFIFKGGFLLSYLIKIGRETTDLDFLAHRIDVEQGRLEEIFKQICSLKLDDGFSFLFKGLEKLVEPDMDYQSYRICLKAKFGRMEDTVFVDIGVGDVVKPERQPFNLTAYHGDPLFEKEIHLYAYPLDSVFAEKLESILSKGSRNSRMKDYHDLFLMQRQPGILDGEKLRESVRGTFQNRSTQLRSIFFDDESLKRVQEYWKAHCEGLGMIADELNLPKNILHVIDEINRFLQVEVLI